MRLKVIFFFILLFVPRLGMAQDANGKLEAEHQRELKRLANYSRGESSRRMKVELLNGQSKKRLSNRVASSEFIQAEKAWKPFWEEFRRVIKDRDREGMRRLISEDYSATDCDKEIYLPKYRVIPCGRENGINDLSPTTYHDDRWQDIEYLIAEGVARTVKRGSKFYYAGVPGRPQKSNIQKVLGKDYFLKYSESVKAIVFSFRDGQWFLVAYIYNTAE
jgi:hypothetical protein